MRVYVCVNIYVCMCVCVCKGALFFGLEVTGALAQCMCMYKCGCMRAKE